MTSLPCMTHHEYDNDSLNLIKGPSASAYVTYNSTDAALKCIQEVNGMYQEGRTLKATLGTTKYCSRYDSS